MLWPWNGGASSLRRARCSLPSSAKTDPGPKIRLRFGCTFIRSSVLARNTCRANAGSETTTLRPKNGTLMANTGPKRFTAYCKNERRNPDMRTIWIGLGRRTAGGILPGVVGAFVPAGTAVSVTGESLPAVSLVLRCTVGVCSTVPLGTRQAQGLPGGEMTTALDRVDARRRAHMSPTPTRSATGYSTGWPHRSVSADIATPRSPTSSGTRAPRSAPSTSSSPARKSA